MHRYMAEHLDGEEENLNWMALLYMLGNAQVWDRKLRSLKTEHKGKFTKEIR